ncbi:TonB-dependent siderophore receptor [Variovorax sp. KBW07]|uniref:TonB-dependent siderophore receptor n=1 Tax=Variovorax sp. KBW07 TaxID=2153358 RepID=UPI000F58AFE7|nr:TonB-dependent receptor [Variovorax sp. KBW07]RQO48701.1 TonB-dependent siderophore receptor [Variovorax sp. KBW07]
MPALFSSRHRLQAVATATALMCALHVHAQAPATAATAAADSAVHVYDLPAQPLGSTLARIAGTSSQQISMDAEQVRGLNAPAVRGSLTAQQAVRMALAGSGLELVRTDSGNWSVRKLAAPAPRSAAMPAAEGGALGEVLVTAQAEPGATSEGTGSYAARAVTIGKQEQRLRDVPQSVSVLTRQQLDDRNLGSLDDAMRTVTGISVETSSTGGNHGNFYARGYALDSVQIDGVVTPASTGNDLSTGFGMAIYDRLEVLRGPAGLFQGAGDPGGTINLVRKRAQKDFAARYELTAGSWDRYEGQVDVTGPLNASGSVRGRLVAAYQDRHSFVDYVNSRKPLLYGTVDVDLGANTTLTGGITYQQYKGRPAFGLPAYTDGRFLDVRRSTNLDPAWNHITEEVKEYFGELNHRLANGGQAKLSLVYREQDEPTRKFGWSDCAVDRPSGDSCYISWMYRSHWRTYSADAFVTTPFDAFGRTHQVTVGADYRNIYKTFQYGGGDSGYINAYQPDNNVSQPSYAFDNGNRGKTTQYGTYARANLKATDRLQAVLGGRLSWWENTAHNRNAYFNQFTDTHAKVSRKFTPFAGLVYELSDNLSAYASYSSIFAPQIATDVAGQTLRPRTGKQAEVGLKAELFDKQANAHVALFRMQDVNRAMTDPDNLLFSIAAGKMRNEGLEAEITGRLSPRWDLSAGYAFTRTKTLEGTDEQKRQLYTYIAPRHTFNVWTRYRFGPGALQGFSVGGGVRAVSSTYRLAGDVKFEQKPYAVASLQVGYRFNPKLEATLTVDNLFDKVYYQRVWAAFGSNFYGEPRSFTLALRGKF